MPQPDNREVSMNKKTLLTEIGTVVVGSALFGASLSLFLTPCGVVMGGASGLSVTINHFVRLPVGLCIFLLNLPLLLLNIRITGIKHMSRTIIAVAATSLFTDLLSFLPAATDDPLLGAFCGGALMGGSSAIMLMRGYTTGGSDLAAYLIHHQIRRVKVGTAVLVIDAIIVLGSAIALRRFDGIIYSISAVIAYSVALDAVMNGLGRAKLAMIISDRYAEIGDAITKNISRGATVLRGIGWYTGVNRNVVMCVMKRSELFALKKLVNEIDPNAFVIVSDAAEVLGSGFEK